jgi:two-component system sensor histidine kinase KdpD
VTVAARELASPAASAAASGLADEPTGEVEISVIDDGTGIPAELALAPFDSARRHRSTSSGAGLGLSIARGIVEAHGGAIQLVPAPVGTTFRIRIPVEGALSAGTAADAHDAADAVELPGLLSGVDTALRAMIESADHA